MVPDQYTLDALYRARRQDELGEVEIDGNRYRKTDVGRNPARRRPRLPIRRALAMLLRRYPQTRPAPAPEP